MKKFLRLRTVAHLTLAMLLAGALMNGAAILGAQSGAPAKGVKRTQARAEVQGRDIQDGRDSQRLGSGDGRIHVIPALSAPSVKNGGKLKILAMVKAVARVAKVEAEIEGVTRLELKLSAVSQAGGVTRSDGSYGSYGANGVELYQAEWTARGLEEKVYTVTLRVTDRSGHVYVDHSLTFSDPAAGNSTPGSTAYPNFKMQRVGALSFVTPENGLLCAVVDPSGNYAYFGSEYNYTPSSTITKVRLSDFTRVGVLTMNSGERSLSSAVIDPSGTYAYFGTGNFTSEGTVIKIRLSDFTRVGALTLNAGNQEIYLDSALIDSAGEFAYFGTGTSPGRIIKVRLSDFTRVGALTLNDGENVLRGAVIDPANGYAYYGTGTLTNGTAGMVIKIRLSDFTRVGALTLNEGETFLECAVIDTANGFAYFGTAGWPGQIIKVRLSDFTRQAALTLNEGENMLDNAFIDPAGGYAYFCTSTEPANLVKVRLSDFTRVGALTLNADETYPPSMAFDPKGCAAYIGLYTTPGRVVKVALSSKNDIHANKITLTEKGILNDVRFYSHTAAGNFRLAIYDNALPKKLLWQSPSTSNTAANAWLSVPVNKGTPAALTLQPGTYWLAWQIDSSADVPSYTAGTYGNEFVSANQYGSFPGEISNAKINPTANLWSEYLTYTVGHDLMVVSPYGSPLPAVGTRTYADGSAVAASVASPVSGGTGVRYVCTGWTGSGSVPASGAGTNTNFTITQDSSLTWQWKTQYKLTATADPASRGAVKLADGVTAANGTWHDAGQKLTLRAMPAAGSHFAFWWGKLGGRTNPGSLTLGAPATVGARFDKSSNGVAGWELYGE